MLLYWFVYGLIQPKVHIDQVKHAQESVNSPKNETHKDFNGPHGETDNGFKAALWDSVRLLELKVITSSFSVKIILEIYTF